MDSNARRTFPRVYDAAVVRTVPLDGALLSFDRATGIGVLSDGPETAHLTERAPRVVQFGITNATLAPRGSSCAFSAPSREQHKATKKPMSRSASVPPPSSQRLPAPPTAARAANRKGAQGTPRSA